MMAFAPPGPTSSATVVRRWRNRMTMSFMLAQVRVRVSKIIDGFTPVFDHID